jgi:glycosyltransferase involved in cell wall biosynthesis
VPSPSSLLVFAHTPPPIHGQSLMVQTLLEGLPSVAPQIVLHHVNPRLSRDASDIGRWRPGKLLALLGACVHALALRARLGPMTFYYVPAPGKRSALYRDFLVMLLCRPFFTSLVLHWHAAGLGEWLATNATPLERWLAQRLLGRAALSIVLAPELAADAQHLRPRRTSIVPNGIDLPETHNSKPTTQNPDSPPSTRNLEHRTRNSTEVLYLGLCSREKGIFDTLAALAIANRREPAAFRLTVAGGFASVRDQHAFFSQVLALGRDLVRHVGFANAAEKQALLASADVFCFPTAYPHEGQPLALIEALAHDLPIVTTRWRAIPLLLPSNSDHIHFVTPGRPDQIAEALFAARQTSPPHGQLRAHYLAHYTRERHLAALAAALASLDDQ